jgi:dodecin
MISSALFEHDLRARGLADPEGASFDLQASSPREGFVADQALTEGEDDMAESVYKVIELIGTSKESWEKAASAAVERAGKTLRELRVAEVAELDLQLDAKGKVEAYRAKLRVSFKFED